MIKAFIIAIALVMSCAQSASAQSSSPLEQLSAGHVDATEDMFSRLQTKFEKGLASEYELLDAYKAFYQREDRYRAQLNMWIKSYPKSASAYLARGVYYRKLGEFRRGTSYIAQVPRENLSYMTQMFSLAKIDLEAALGLNPKSYLAMLHLLNIAQFEGDDRAADKYLAAGNAVLPSNFLVRARYLIHLTPRWGGSYRRMDSFIEECQSRGVAQDKIDLLNAIKRDDQGAVAGERGSTAQAQALYKEALLLARSAGPRFRRDYLGFSAGICSEPEHRSKEYCQ